MTSSTTRHIAGDMNRSHGSFELVVSPVILALLGWWLDAKVTHTTPWITVSFAVLGLVGAVIKLYYGYKLSMAELAEGSAWRNATSVDLAPADDASNGKAA